MSSMASFSDVVFLTAAAGALVKIIDVTFAYFRDRNKAKADENLADDASDSKFRADLIGRIVELEKRGMELEKRERDEIKKVQALERKLTRVIGMLVVFRLCQRPDCPIVESLRKSGDLEWLDNELLERNENSN